MIGVILANGNEEIESITIIDILRRAGVEVKSFSLEKNLLVTGAHDIIMQADEYLENLDCQLLSGIVLPGGMPGAKFIAENENLKNIVIDMNKSKKLICAICAAPIALSRWGLLQDKNITCYPGFESYFKDANLKDAGVVKFENVITAKGPSYALEFTLDIAEHIKGKDIVMKLKKDLLIGV